MGAQHEECNLGKRHEVRQSVEMTKGRIIVQDAKILEHTAFVPKQLREPRKIFPIQ